MIIAKKPSLGVRLQFTRDQNDATAMMAAMLMIFIIGVLADSVFFARLERGIRHRWGLVDGAT